MIIDILGLFIGSILLGFFLGLLYCVIKGKKNDKTN